MKIKTMNQKISAIAHAIEFGTSSNKDSVFALPVFEEEPQTVYIRIDRNKYKKFKEYQFDFISTAYILWGPEVDKFFDFYRAYIRVRLFYDLGYKHSVSLPEKHPNGHYGYFISIVVARQDVIFFDRYLKRIFKRPSNFSLNSLGR